MSQQFRTYLEGLDEEDGTWNEGERVIQVFQSAFTPLPDLPDGFQSDLDELANHIASKLRPLVPPERFAEAATKTNPFYEVSHRFQNFWGGMFQIASRVPHQDDQSHTLLVKVTQALNEESFPWKDLPGLQWEARDWWNKAPISVDFSPEQDEQLKVNQWLNLNSFVARLFGAGVLNSHLFPICEIRLGLEDYSAKPRGFCSPAEAVDSMVAVASEWLIQAGPAILKQCLVDETEELDADARRMLKGGDYFLGRPGFNLERWGFWKRRLRELRLGVSKEVATSVDRAIETMVRAEKALVGN